MAKKKNVCYATGRRKCAVARVWLEPGEGKITVNGREFKDYFRRPVLEILVESPIKEIEMERAKAKAESSTAIVDFDSMF